MIVATLATSLPYVAIAVAIATFVASQREFGRRAKVDYVAGLEERIEECEKDRKDLRVKLQQLRDENVDLMRRVVRVENGGAK